MLFQIGVIGNKTLPSESTPLTNENHKDTPNDSKEDDVGEKNKDADSEMSGSKDYKATPKELNPNVDSENQGAPKGKSEIGQVISRQLLKSVTVEIKSSHLPTLNVSFYIKIKRNT